MELCGGGHRFLGSGVLETSLGPSLSCRKYSFGNYLCRTLFFGLANGVRGAQSPLCVGVCTSLCLPVKSQAGANSEVTHAGDSVVPGLGQQLWLVGEQEDPAGQYWAVGLGNGALKLLGLLVSDQFRLVSAAAV